MNDSLTKEVMEEELCSTIYSFQNGKNPRTDGFSVEFFLGFYDLIKEYLLKVVIESQHSRKFLGSMNSTFLALIPKKQKPTDLEISDRFPIAM